MKASLRVVFADDHPFYREGMSRLLRHKGIQVLAEVPNAEAAIRAAAEQRPDVVLLDLNMPGLPGAEAIRRIRNEAPGTPVLVLSVSAEAADVVDALVAGASGYVLKDGSVEDVIAGLEAAAAGRSLLSPRVATVVSNQQ